MNTYVESECAIIYRTRDRFGAGSNMASGFPIRALDMVFHSTEALYQCFKYHDPIAVAEKINLPVAANAKRAAYLLDEPIRPDWDEIKLGVMEECLNLKLLQHQTDVGAFLDLTGGREIVEKSFKDNFWGAIPNGRGVMIGHNALGNLWMIIREEDRQGTLREPNLEQFLQTI